jgi:D-alanyl-D-alanine carboxypeptidase (penicillin-binding protein 5/6)
VFRAAAVFAAVAVGALGTPPPALAAGPVPALPDLNVASYVVVDYDTGQILAERSPHRALYPASTLKVLTADTLIPRLSASMAVTPKASDFTAEPDGSVVGMTAGVTYTVADLWHATFIDSANDAVAELAHLAGGQDTTVALMQKQARTLGAYDTVVADADGYDVDGQVTSAYDLAVLARAGLHNAAFRGYCALREATFPGPAGKGIALKSHDPMLMSYPGMIGIKGGITTKAGHTYVGAATRDGHTIIETLMLGGTDIFDQAAHLMDWGFAADGRVTPVAKLGGGASPASSSPTPSPTPTPSPKTPSSPSTASSTPTASAPPTSPSPTSPSPSPAPTTSVTPSTPSASRSPQVPRTTVTIVITAVAAPTVSPSSDPAAPHALLWGLLAAGGTCAIPLATLFTGRRRPPH